MLCGLWSSSYHPIERDLARCGQPVETAGIGAEHGGVVGNGDELQTQCQPLFVFTRKPQNRPVAAPNDAGGAENLQDRFHIGPQSRGLAPLPRLGQKSGQLAMNIRQEPQTCHSGAPRAEVSRRDVGFCPVIDNDGKIGMPFGEGG